MSRSDAENMQPTSFLSLAKDRVTRYNPARYGCPKIAVTETIQ